VSKRYSCVYFLIDWDIQLSNSLVNIYEWSGRTKNTHIRGGNKWDIRQYNEGTISMMNLKSVRFSVFLMIGFSIQTFSLEAVGGRSIESEVKPVLAELRQVISSGSWGEDPIRSTQVRQVEEAAEVFERILVQSGTSYHDALRKFEESVGGAYQNAMRAYNRKGSGRDKRGPSDTQNKMQSLKMEVTRVRKIMNRLHHFNFAMGSSTGETTLDGYTAEKEKDRATPGLIKHDQEGQEMPAADIVVVTPESEGDYLPNVQVGSSSDIGEVTDASPTLPGGDESSGLDNGPHGESSSGSITFGTADKKDAEEADSK